MSGNDELSEEQLEELLDATEGDLRKTYLEMQKPDWVLAVKKLEKEGETDDEKKELYRKALKAELSVLDAIQEIEATKLQAIADQLKKQAPELRAARKDLRNAVKNMENVAKAIDGISKVLGVLTKVITSVGQLLI